MNENEIIETIGSITKMEHLRSLEQDTLPNSLVLRTVDPFPGYKVLRKEDKQLEKPGSLFVILRYRYTPEKINRINRDLISAGFVRRYPSFGEIITREAILPCIRLKGVENFNQIKGIQEFFKRNDLKFMDFRKLEGDARIKIFKTFRLKEISEGIYRDLNEGEKIYLRIPRAINWKRLDYITRKIKTRKENSNFDAALGVIYRFCGPEDVIRIYDQEKTLKRALYIRKLFIKEVNKDVLITTDQHTVL